MKYNNHLRKSKSIRETDFKEPQICFKLIQMKLLRTFQFYTVACWLLVCALRGFNLYYKRVRYLNQMPSSRRDTACPRRFFKRIHVKWVKKGAGTVALLIETPILSVWLFPYYVCEVILDILSFSLKVLLTWSVI